MSATCSEVRPGAYHDSVVLMQLQKALADLPGVLDAGVVMGTEANRELLEESGLLTPDGAAAGPDDLLIAVKAEEETAAAEALQQVDALLRERRSRSSQAFRPRSLASAARALPQAQWVLISVPGRYAAEVARDALKQQKHVFLYSDNVSLEDELDLKKRARAQGLLVMGPDCGTALINGVGLGFANHVRRGKIGLVAASGTGLQTISTHIHRLGGGISQAIGTGGRDLAEHIGGITSRQALDLLGRDPQTEVIVLVSKPSAPAVAARLLAAARSSGKPVVVYFMGQPPPALRQGNISFALNLRQAAELALGVSEGFPAEQAASSQGTVPDRPETGSRRGYLRGLFSGGTLAYELMLGLQTTLVPLYSNVSLHGAHRLDNPHRSRAHTIVDLGEDEFTQGRLHPMMDNTLRIRRLRQEAADPETGLIVLDVVLGEGAHPDPAAELGPAIEEVVEQKQVPIAVLLVGTDEDPQDIEAQAEKLAAAGATIFYDTSALIAKVSTELSRPTGDQATQVALDAFQTTLAAINVGLESFYESLQGQGAAAVHVAWRPPAGGNEKMMSLLSQLKS